MLLALVSIIGYLMSILSTVVIVQFILSLLIAFNVVSLSNNIVASIWQALNVILDPFLKLIYFTDCVSGSSTSKASSIQGGSI